MQHLWYSIAKYYGGKYLISRRMKYNISFKLKIVVNAVSLNNQAAMKEYGLDEKLVYY